jgi:hypothetical protein
LKIDTKHLKQLNPKLLDDIIKLIEKIEKEKCYGTKNQAPLIAEILCNVYNQQQDDKTYYVAYKRN